MGVVARRLERYPFLVTGRFLAAALGHFAVDFFNSLRPLLWALFSLRLGLTNTEIGFFAMSATLMAALSQPLFGWLADKYGGRVFGALGLLWIAVLYAVVGTLHGRLVLWALVLAALGSGAFHPQGAMNAAQAGGDRRTLATSLFFTFGQIALGIGPAIGGVLLGLFDVQVLVVLAVLALPIVVLMWHHTPNRRTTADAGEVGVMRSRAREFGTGRQRVALLVAFVLLVFFRSWAGHSNIAFLPKFLQDRGWAQELQGVALTAYMLSSAIAVVIFGRLADDIGRRPMLTLGLFMAVVPMYLYPRVSGPGIFALVALTGACIGGVHSILIVMAQDLLPHRMALASGLALGFMFASGGVGQMITGALADVIGLDRTLSFLAVPLFLAGLLSLFLWRWATGQADVISQ